MKFTENDIEFYLLNKSYKDLSQEELKRVGEAVKDEVEYNELRNLLLVMQEVPAEELLIPNASTKQKLVAEFEKVNAVKVVPIQHEEKETKKRKGIFWLSVAASIALVVGLFLSKDALFPKNESQLAQLEQKNTQNIKEDIKVLKEGSKNSIIKSDEVRVLNDNEDLENIEDLDQLETESISINDKELEVMPNKRTAMPQFSEVTASAGNKLKIEPETAPAEDFVLMDVEELNEKEVITAFDEVSDLDDTTLGAVKLNDGDKALSQITTSVSLKKDEELIDLLYTAM